MEIGLENLYVDIGALRVNAYAVESFNDDIFQGRTGDGKPGKSWNLRILFSTPGKSWNLIVGP